MILGLAFAAAIGCHGAATLSLGGTYIRIAPPAPDKRACVYQRWPDGDWAIYMFTIHYQLNMPLCKEVHPRLEFGRVEVPEEEYCPANPEGLEPVKTEVNSHETTATHAISEVFRGSTGVLPKACVREQPPLLDPAHLCRLREALGPADQHPGHQYHQESHGRLIVTGFRLEAYAGIAPRRRRLPVVRLSARGTILASPGAGLATHPADIRTPPAAVSWRRAVRAARDPGKGGGRREQPSVDPDGHPKADGKLLWDRQ